MVFLLLYWHTVARMVQWNTSDDWYMLCQLSIPFNEMSNIIPGC